MQFKVPQFLDIEDKIFGPFTFRQFVYLAGGGGLCFVFFRILGFWWGAIPILLVAGLVLALAFYRPNSKPFISMLESAFKYFFQNKLYIWEKRKVYKERKRESDSMPVASIPFEGARLTGEKLRDLAWSLDVLDLKKVNKDEEDK
jgi:hypothetical protein